MFGRNNPHGKGPFRTGSLKNTVDICVCPSCGYAVEHECGVPCNTLLCPKCDCHLVRKIVIEIPEDNVAKKSENKKSAQPFPKVNPELCMGCGECEAICPISAISIIDGVAFIDESKCRKCRLCVTVCPSEAIS
jgi:Na+-translocating ferredoxin:NAD+ oxidoreductase subunit B